MGILYYLLAVVGGLFAGFVTTLAGLGSVLTLYILIDVLELEAGVANGTNRLGILAMCIMALPSFYQKGHLNLNKSWPIILTIFIGAMGGVILALNIDNSAFKEVFKYLLFVMLALVLTNPQKWVRETDTTHQLNWWIGVPVFLIMGFYAGFIQVGTGVFLVIFLALVGKYSLLDANGIKLAAFGIYTFVLIIIFGLSGKINWPVGLCLALGQGIGAYFTAKLATAYPKANSLVRYLLIVVLIIAIIRMFKLYTYFM